MDKVKKLLRENLIFGSVQVRCSMKNDDRVKKASKNTANCNIGVRAYATIEPEVDDCSEFESKLGIAAFSKVESVELACDISGSFMGSDWPGRSHINCSIEKKEYLTIQNELFDFASNYLSSYLHHLVARKLATKTVLCQKFVL